MHARLIAITAVLLGALALQPARAEACSCIAPGLLGVVMPRQGERVPANARIWVVAYDAEALSISAPDGTSVPFDVSSIALEVGMFGPAELYVLSPRAPLPPGQGYSVRSDPQETLVTFDVEAAIDDDAPPAPEVLDIEAEVIEDIGNSCGKHRGVAITVEAEGLTFVWLADEGGVGPELLAGTALEAQPAQDGRAYYAYGVACGPGWPGEETLRLKLVSFDVAGNRSDESKDITIERPQYSASACSVMRVAPTQRSALGAGLWLLSLGALYARARCRPRSAASYPARASARARSSTRS